MWWSSSTFVTQDVGHPRRRTSVSDERSADYDVARSSAVASIYPVRQIPMGSRPTQAVKSDTPWLDDDAITASSCRNAKAFRS